MPLRQEQSVIERSWKLLELSDVNGGLNTAAPAYSIAENQTPDVLNLIARDGILRVDTGYSQLGVDVYQQFHQVLTGTPQKIIEHIAASGARELLCITQTTVYKLSSSGMWEVITDGTSDTLASTVGASDTSITLNDASSFSVGDVIGIIDDSGNVLSREVGLKVSNDLHFVPSTPPGFSASIGNTVHRGAQLNGNDNNPVSAVTVPSHNWLVFTNNVDVPKRYDGNTVQDIPGLSAATITAARCVSLFSNSLHLGNVVQGGTRKPQTVYWADIGDPTNWTTANSGDESLFDSRSEIMSMKPMGDHQIIYSDRAITREEFVNTDNILFLFRTMVYGLPDGLAVGALSPDSVIVRADGHLVMSRDGVYSYRGGFSVSRVSDPIFHKIFGTTGNLGQSKSIRSFVQFMDQRDEFYFFYPSTEATAFCDRALILSREGTWFYRDFIDEITCAGPFIAGSAGPTIAQLQGTIIEQQWIIGGSGLQSGVPRVAMGASDGKTYDYDYIAVKDDNRAIPWHIVLREIRGFTHNLRFDRFDLLMSGDSITVEYSTNGGVTWSSLGTVSPGVKVSLARLYMQVVTERILIRLSGNNPSGFALSGATFRFRNENRWAP